MHGLRTPLAGRLQQMSDRWRNLPLTLPLEVAHLLQCGVRLAFFRHPPPLGGWARQYRLQKGEREGLNVVLQEYLQLGAVQAVPQDTPLFLSPVFGRPKPEAGKWRLIMDLKALNRYIRSEHFHMEDIRAVTRMLQPGDFLTKLDLKHAYFHLPIAEAHRPWMGFQWDGQKYIWRTMCFGLNTAPRLWSKTIRVPVKLLRSWGVRMVFYIDDLLVAGRSVPECLQHAVTVARLLMWLGYEIEFGKTDLQPKQHIRFLGFELDTTTMQVACSSAQLQAAAALARKLLNKHSLSARQLGSAIGTFCALRQGLEPAYLWTRALNMCKCDSVRRAGWDGAVTLSAEARIELNWWMTHARHYNGVPMHSPNPSWVLTTDSSDLAWGATLTARAALPHTWCASTVAPTTITTRMAREMWNRPSRRSATSVNALELEAGRRALQTFVSDLRGTTVLWQCDNQTVVWDTTKWKSRVPEINQKLRLLFLWTRLHHVTLTTVHVSGDTNKTADWLSRWVERSDWQLHPRLFHAIMKQRLWCQVDAFASAGNHLLPRYWSLLWSPGAEAHNFFAQNLALDRLWVNPPFALIPRVLVALQQHRARGVIVVPRWESQPWWPVLMNMTTAPPLSIPRTRQTFRPISRHNASGVGLPPWPLLAVQFSGDKQEQRNAQQLWGPALCTPDMSLLRQLPHLLRTRSTVDDMQSTWCTQSRLTSSPYCETPW